MWGRVAQQRLPLGEKLSPKVTDEERFCTQPFLVEDRPVAPTPFFSAPLGESIAPHPPQCAHWAPSQRGRLWGGVRPLSDYNTHPPSPPSWGRAVTSVGLWAGASPKKKEDPRLQNQVESRGEPLPSGPLSPVSREKRGPPPGRRPTGRCAPRHRKSPDHP